MVPEDIFADRHRPRRRRWRVGPILLVLLVALGAAGFYGWRALQDSFLPPSCQYVASTVESLDPEQAGNAALIAAVATQRGLPPRATTIALATAMQESKLRNIRYGDRDSLGLFQQRPSMGWGTEAQVLDPVYSTNKFFDVMVKIKGWEQGDITTIAQRVQRSGFPEAYRKHEQFARSIASVLTGQSGLKAGCRLLAVREVGTSQAVGADLSAQLGVKVTTDGNRVMYAGTDDALTVQVAMWAVSRADVYGVTRVRLGDQQWQRDGRESLTWQSGKELTAPGQVVIELGPVDVP